MTDTSALAREIAEELPTGRYALMPVEPSNEVFAAMCAIPGISLDTGRRMYAAALRASTQGGEDSSLSTKPTEAEGWRTDLDNAPKDAEPILIAIKGVKLPWNDADVIVRQARFRPGGAWITDFDAYYPKDIIGWMPLPPAPAAPAKGEGA